MKHQIAYTEVEQRRARLRERLNRLYQDMDQLRLYFTTVRLSPSPEGAVSTSDVSWTDPEAERLHTLWAAYAAELQRELQRQDAAPAAMDPRKDIPFE